jgi:hypothetical protein
LIGKYGKLLLRICLRSHPYGNLVAIEKKVAISNVRVGEIILFRKPVPDYEADVA